MDPARARTDPDALSAALKALSHPKRLRLLRFLAEPHYLEEIANELGVARQSAQEHLDQLLAQGMVVALRGRRDHGPVTDYVLAMPRLFEIHEELGARFGVLAAELDERVSLPQATGVLPAGRAAPSVRDLPRLTIVHGMRVGETTVLEGPGPWVIGRDANARLALEYDPFVSHRHAEVRRFPGGFEVADALSSNGTWVDWTPLARGGTAPLANGTLLRVGKTLLLFRRA